MTTFIWIHIHDVIDDVTRSQSRSNFEISISQTIFELERRSKAQNIGNANGYLFGIFNFRYNFRWKGLSRAQNGGHFENFDISSTASIWPQIWKDRSKLYKKKFFMVMASSMTSQSSLKVSHYIHVWERLAPGASCKDNVSSVNANIIIVFLGYTCQKTISMNNTFRNCRSNIQRSTSQA